MRLKLSFNITSVRVTSSEALFELESFVVSFPFSILQEERRYTVVIELNSPPLLHKMRLSIYCLSAYRNRRLHSPNNVGDNSPIRAQSPLQPSDRGPCGETPNALVAHSLEVT